MFNDKAKAFVRDLITRFGQPVKQSEGDTTDSRHHCILNIEVGEIIKIRQSHITGYDIAVLVILLIVLLTLHFSGNFTEDEFEHIFHGDNTRHLTIFTQNDSSTGIVRLKVVEHLVHLLGGRHVMRRLQDHIQSDPGEITPASDQFQYIFGMDKTDHIVPVSLVYGYTGMAMAAKLLYQFWCRKVRIKKYYTGTRRHNS